MQPQLKQIAVPGRGGFRKLAYVEWGPPRADRTVVCLHGLSRTGRDFDTRLINTGLGFTGFPGVW